MHGVHALRELANDPVTALSVARGDGADPGSAVCVDGTQCPVCVHLRTGIAFRELSGQPGAYICVDHQPKNTGRVHAHGNSVGHLAGARAAGKQQRTDSDARRRRVDVAHQLDGYEAGHHAADCVAAGGRVPCTVYRAGCAEQSCNGGKWWYGVTVEVWLLASGWS